ncbi:hypothetical protein [Bradyrhizobium sp. Gha]|uniref:hypothetical protein n=1 Tax=Bradyrhizobium sp. Gha TaxID=1855318 RepID=UPI0008E52076|nr:hypothetical protein [Bradyrhizobium sp. Gha]SFI39920.1 hypothetical protein SAMN05216525_10870 [Bradyrhizobium sp. Gha]
MDPRIYERLWDETVEAYDPTVLRTRRHKHPIVEKWLADDARGSDPAFNTLYFLYRPYFRKPVRRRRLRFLNTLMWVLKSEGFTIEADDKNIIVGHGSHRTKFKVFEGGEQAKRAASMSFQKLNGRLSCQIEAKLPEGIETRWEDDFPARRLEDSIPNIIASFTVWAFERKRSARG